MYCARYVHAGMLDLQDKLEFHIATDAGSINRLPLQDTAIGAQNLVVLACPNVVPINYAKEFRFALITVFPELLRVVS